MRAATLLLSVLAAAPAAAQGRDPVQVKTFASAKRVAPGGEFRIAVQLAMEPGWHVQGNDTPEPYVPTVWRIADAGGLEVGEVLYPSGETLRFFGESLPVYGGNPVLGARVRVPSGKPPGRATIAGEITYQACTEKQCLKERAVPTSIEIEVAAGAAPESLHPEIFAELAKLDAGGGPDGETPKADPRGAPEAKVPEKGLLLTLLGIFLLGFLLNLTPCVYPVVAVTIGFFGRQAGGSPGRRLGLSLAYALGLASTFTALFVLAALTGVGFGAWLQNRFVLLALAALIAAFALSCFGLFQIQAPSWLLARVGGGKAGALGSFLMGLTMGITAAPCVGPLILSLILAVAKEGSVAGGLLWGGSLSAGLALPYVFLGFFSGSVSSLPKAGDWTEWMERVLGFVLLGVAIWFANPLLPEGWLVPALALLLAAAGLWLGLLERSGRTGNGLWFARGAVFVGALVGAWGLFERSEAEALEWKAYEPALLEKAAAAKRPVVLDVTAAWCLPCKIMEETTFKDPRVIREAEPFERLRVDLTGEPDEKVRDAIRRFGEEVRGEARLDPPQLIFLGPDGRERKELRAVEKIDAEEMLARLRGAR